MLLVFGFQISQCGVITRYETIRLEKDFGWHWSRWEAHYWLYTVQTERLYLILPIKIYVRGMLILNLLNFEKSILSWFYMVLRGILFLMSFSTWKVFIFGFVSFVNVSLTITGFWNSTSKYSFVLGYFLTLVFSFLL